MEPVLRPEEMRAADEATMASGVGGAELMDRASHACAVTALRLLGGAYGKCVVVVAGKGNNGGDGIACARHLARAGVRVNVLLAGEPKGDAAHHRELLRAVSPRGLVREGPWSPSTFTRAAARADLVIDALLGTGLGGAPSGEIAGAIEAIRGYEAPVLAVDIPSGVDGSDASVPGACVRADVTVAIQALKVGHVRPPGAWECGRVDVADIGIGPLEASVFVPGASDVRAVLPVAEPDTHKYRVGALAVLAGSAGMTGAAVLTARGAIRSGAGLVFMGVPASALEVAEGAVIEAVKVPLPDVEGHIDPKAVDEMSDRLERCRALAVGPGLGRGPRAVALVRRTLDVPLSIVIDGDGLWALGECLREEPGVLRERSEPAILTPHSGEFTYLGGDASAPDTVAAVRDLSGRLGAVVHLKGRRALTASPDGTVWVNPTGHPGMATGGTGDVLTGVVGSFLAQGVDAPAAMWAGAYLHGLAGDIAAERGVRASVGAADLPEALPAALRRVARPAPRADRLRTVLEPAT